MSHSFYEVLPYILTEGYNETVLDTDLLLEILGDENKVSKIEDMFYELTNPDNGTILELDLPQFTGVHFETKEERTFDAKAFSVTIVNCEESMDSCSEGKTEYGYAIYLIDNDSGEKMYAWADYYAAIDKYLTSFGIELEDSNTVIKEPTVFVILEKMVSEGFLMHGIFDSLDKAVDNYKLVKKHNKTTNKNVSIEEVAMNKPLLYTDDYDDSGCFLREAISKYKINGTLIETF